MSRVAQTLGKVEIVNMGRNTLREIWGGGGDREGEREGDR